MAHNATHPLDLVWSDGELPTGLTRDDQRAMLALLTQDDIDGADATIVRRLAGCLLPAYSHRATVARIDTGEAVMSTPGALTAIDECLTTLAHAYPDGEPRRESEWQAVSLTVWYSDAQLRSSLAYYSREAVRLIAVEMAEATDDNE